MDRKRTVGELGYNPTSVSIYFRHCASRCACWWQLRHRPLVISEFHMVKTLCVSEESGSCSVSICIPTPTWRNVTERQCPDLPAGLWEAYDLVRCPVSYHTSKPSTPTLKINYCGIRGKKRKECIRNSHEIYCWKTVVVSLVSNIMGA